MSFYKAWQRVQQLREEENDVALSAITTGNNVADNFWENFIQVCNNKDGVSALLGVSPDKVASWQVTIKEKLDQSDSAVNVNTNNKVLSTGELKDEKL